MTPPKPRLLPAVLGSSGVTKLDHPVQPLFKVGDRFNYGGSKAQVVSIRRTWARIRFRKNRRTYHFNENIDFLNALLLEGDNGVEIMLRIS